MGLFAASYVDADRRPKHSLIEPVLDGSGIQLGYRIHGDSTYFPTMHELVAFYGNVLVSPFHDADDPHLGLVKDLVIKSDVEEEMNEGAEEEEGM